MSEAEAEDNSVSCVTFVSYQQAASGAPKCTICDQVCHGIIPCTAATNDEDVLKHMTSAFTAREQQRQVNRKQRHLFFFLNIFLFNINTNSQEINPAFSHLLCKARQNISLYWMCRDDLTEFLM